MFYFSLIQGIFIVYQKTKQIDFYQQFYNVLKKVVLFNLKNMPQNEEDGNMTNNNDNNRIMNDVDDDNDDDDDDEEDLEKLQAEIARMEEEAARITKETEALEQEDNKNKTTSTSTTAGAAKDANKPARDNCSIYVGQVDYSATPEELLKHFDACGTVERVTIVCDKFTGRPKGKLGWGDAAQ